LVPNTRANTKKNEFDGAFTSNRRQPVNGGSDGFDVTGVVVFFCFFSNRGLDCSVAVRLRLVADFFDFADAAKMWWKW
jgi:hypothetical protein